MEIQLTSGFLSLLFLIWLPTGTISQTEKSDIRQCKLEIWSKNLTVHVKWYEPKGLESWNQTNTMAPGENCTNLISPCMSAAHVGTCEFSISITRINSTDTGNGTQETVPRCCLAGLQTNVTEEKIWTGLNLLCIFFGLAVGTLIYTPILGFLLWQCRRNRTGKITSREVAEVDQLSREAPVTGTEDLTYANLKFEKETKPASSSIIYTEIKPSQ
ncbi:uncharacterized protein LOC113948769 [Corapipo altera]|uniref:uncharacterized protein LOC113948769 n=1 Tax=Corapipo altera TaxID=415028 RepID=UPI000FD64804|nr:uncharacterized protein LOC113948769 [Corapipo altera]